MSPLDRHAARPRAARHLLGLPLGIALAVLAVAPVLAHAELATADPADKSTLDTPPTAVTLTFTESLDGTKSSFKLLAPDGSTVGTGQKTGDKEMSLQGLTLGPGAYEIQWTSASAQDGDIARGTLTFTVAATSASPSASPSDAASSPASAVPSPSAAPSPTPDASPVVTPVSSSGGSDVILPIVVALVALAIGAAYLVRRSRRA